MLMSATEVNATPLNILVVDDHMLMRKLVTQQLKSFGYETVDTATNGQEALELLQSKRQQGIEYDIVFVDWGMPVMNGLELVCKCKGDFDNTAFVMLTGETEKSYVMEALEHGVSSYIVKPVSQDTLQQKLEHVIDWLRKKRGNDEFYVIQ